MSNKGQANRVPNPYSVSRELPLSVFEWWRNRSSSMKVIMLFQFLHTNYMWDDTVEPITIPQLATLIGINARANRAWTEGINKQFLKRAIHGYTLRPIDLVTRLLGCITWLTAHVHTSTDTNPSSSACSAWPIGLMFADPRPTPQLFIRPRDGSLSGMAAIGEWTPSILEPTFDGSNIYIIITNNSNNTIVNLNTESYRDMWRAPPHEILRMREIADGLRKLHDPTRAYTAAHAADNNCAPISLIPSTRSASTTTTSSTLHIMQPSQSVAATANTASPDHTVLPAFTKSTRLRLVVRGQSRFDVPSLPWTPLRAQGTSTPNQHNTVLMLSTHISSSSPNHDGPSKKNMHEEIFPRPPPTSASPAFPHLRMMFATPTAAVPTHTAQPSSSASADYMFGVALHGNSANMSFGSVDAMRMAGESDVDAKHQNITTTAAVGEAYGIRVSPASLSQSQSPPASPIPFPLSPQSPPPSAPVAESHANIQLHEGFLTMRQLHEDQEQKRRHDTIMPTQHAAQVQPEKPADMEHNLNIRESNSNPSTSDNPPRSSCPSDMEMAVAEDHEYVDHDRDTDMCDEDLTGGPAFSLVNPTQQNNNNKNITSSTGLVSSSSEPVFLFHAQLEAETNPFIIAYSDNERAVESTFLVTSTTLNVSRNPANIPKHVRPRTTTMFTPSKLKLLQKHSDVLGKWVGRLLFPNSDCIPFCLNHAHVSPEHRWLRAFLITWYPPVQVLHIHNSMQPSTTSAAPVLARVAASVPSSSPSAALFVPQFLDYHRSSSTLGCSTRFSVVCVVCHHLACATVERSDMQVMSRLTNASPICKAWWNRMTMDQKAALSNSMAGFRLVSSLSMSDTLDISVRLLSPAELISHGRTEIHRIAILFTTSCGDGVTKPDQVLPTSADQLVPLLVTTPIKGLSRTKTGMAFQNRLKQQYVFISKKIITSHEQTHHNSPMDLSQQANQVVNVDHAYEHDKENINPNTRMPTSTPVSFITPITATKRKSVFDWDELPEEVTRSLPISLSPTSASSSPSPARSEPVAAGHDPCHGLYHHEFKELFQYALNTTLHVVNRDPATTWKYNSLFHTCPFRTNPNSPQASLATDGHTCDTYATWRLAHPEEHIKLMEYVEQNPLASIEFLDPPLMLGPSATDTYKATIRAQNCCRFLNAKRDLKGFEFTCTNCRKQLQNIRRRIKSLPAQYHRTAHMTQHNSQTLVANITRSVSAPVMALLGASNQARLMHITEAIQPRRMASTHPKHDPHTLMSDNRSLRQTVDTLRTALHSVQTRFAAASDRESLKITPRKQNKYINQIFTAMVGDGANDVATTLAKLHKVLVNTDIGPITDEMKQRGDSSKHDRYQFQVGVVSELIHRLAQQTTRGYAPSEGLFNLATVLRLQLGYSMYSHISHLMMLPSSTSLMSRSNSMPRVGYGYDEKGRVKLYDVTRIGINPFRVQQAVVECRVLNGDVSEPWVLSSDAGRCTRRIDALMMDTDDMLQEDKQGPLRTKQVVLIGMKQPQYIPLSELLSSPKQFMSQPPAPRSFDTMSESDVVVEYLRQARVNRGYASEYHLMCLSSTMTVNRGAIIAGVEPHDSSTTSRGFTLKMIQMLCHCYLQPQSIKQYTTASATSKPTSLLYRPDHEIAHVMGTSHDNAAYQQSGVLHMQSPRSRVVRGLMAAGVVFCARTWSGIKLISPYLVPHCPLIMTTDYEHFQRLVIKALRKQNAHELTFGIPTNHDTDDPTTPYVTASMQDFRDLLNEIRISNIHGPSEGVVNYTEADTKTQLVYDQRPDSAARFLSIELTEVLARRLGPRSFGTVVYIRMMTYLTEPFHKEEYTGDPERIQRVITKGITMLRMWHHWLVHIRKLSPVYQLKGGKPARFVNRHVFQAAELLFHSATTWMLAYHRHFRHVSSSMSKLTLRRLSSRQCEQLICTLQGKGPAAPTNNPRPILRDIVFHSSRIQKLHNSLATLTRLGAPTYTSKRAAQVDARITRSQSQPLSNSQHRHGAQDLEQEVPTTQVDRANQLSNMSEQEFDDVMFDEYTKGQQEAMKELAQLVPGMVADLTQQGINDLDSLSRSSFNTDRVFVTSITTDSCLESVVSCRNESAPYDSQRSVTSALPPSMEYCKLYQVGMISADSWAFAPIQKDKNAVDASISRPTRTDIPLREGGPDLDQSCTESDVDLHHHLTDDAGEHDHDDPSAERIGVIFRQPVVVDIPPQTNEEQLPPPHHDPHQYEAIAVPATEERHNPIEQDLFDTEIDRINRDMIQAESSQLQVSSSGPKSTSQDSVRPTPYHVRLTRLFTGDSVHIRRLLNQCQSQEWVSRDRRAQFIVSNELPGDVPMPNIKHVLHGSDVMLWLNKMKHEFGFGRVIHIRNKEADRPQEFALWDDPRYEFQVIYYKVTSSSVSDPRLSCRLSINTSSGLKSKWLSINTLIAIVTLTKLANDQHATSQDSEQWMRWDDIGQPSWTETHPEAILRCDSTVNTNLSMARAQEASVSAAAAAVVTRSSDLFVPPTPCAPSTKRRTGISTNVASLTKPAAPCKPVSHACHESGSGSESSIDPMSSGSRHVPTIVRRFNSKKNEEETLALAWDDGHASEMTVAEFIDIFPEQGPALITQFKKQRRKRLLDDKDSQSDAMITSNDESTASDTDTRSKHHAKRTRHTTPQTTDFKDSSTVGTSVSTATRIASDTPVMASGFKKEAPIRVCPVQRAALIAHSRLYVVPSVVCDLTTISHLCFYASVYHQLFGVSDQDTEELIAYNARNDVKNKVLEKLRVHDPVMLAAITPSLWQSVPLAPEAHVKLRQQLYDELASHTDVIRNQPYYFRTVAESIWRVIRDVHIAAYINHCINDFAGKTAAADVYIIPLVANLFNVPICVLTHTTISASTPTTVSSDKQGQESHTIVPYYWCWPSRPNQPSLPRKATTSIKKRPASAKPVKSAKSQGNKDIREMMSTGRPDHEVSISNHTYSHVLVLGYIPSGHYMSMMDPAIELRINNMRQKQWTPAIRDKQADYQRKVYLSMPIVQLMTSPLRQTITNPDAPSFNRSFQTLFDEHLADVMALPCTDPSSTHVMSSSMLSTPSTSKPTTSSGRPVTRSHRHSIPIRTAAQWVSWYTEHGSKLSMTRDQVTDQVMKPYRLQSYQGLVIERQKKVEKVKNHIDTCGGQRQYITTQKHQNKKHIVCDPLHVAFAQDKDVLDAMTQLTTSHSASQSSQTPKIGSQLFIVSIDMNAQLSHVERHILKAMDTCAQEWENTNIPEHVYPSRRIWTPLLRTNNWIVDEVIEGRMQLLQERFWLWDDLPPHHTSTKKHILITSVYFAKKLYDFNTNTYHYGRDIARYCHGPMLAPFNIHDGFHLIIIPYNSGGNHWVLFAIDFKDRRVHLYDSLSSSYGNMLSSCNDKHERYCYITQENWMFMHALAMFIDDEWKVQQATMGHPPSSWEHGYDFTGWHTHVHTETPQQYPNNCGIHIIANAQVLVENAVRARCMGMIASHAVHAQTMASVPIVNPYELPQWNQEQWNNVRKRIAIELFGNCIYTYTRS